MQIVELRPGVESPAGIWYLCNRPSRFAQQMSQSHELRQEDFEALLALLSPNRDDAGVAYERLRRGLIRFFAMRGCSEPESLADETLTRVAARAKSFDPAKNVKVTTFVYGFAAKVLLETFRGRNPREVPLDPEHTELKTEQSDENSDLRMDCLGKCLKHIETADAELLIEYYTREKHEKIELRRQMAEKLGIRSDTLHTRIHRMRTVVGECVRRCVEESL